MADEEKLVRRLSLQERREAVESRLDVLDQQRAILDYFYRRSVEKLKRERKEALFEMLRIIREEDE